MKNVNIRTSFVIGGLVLSSMGFAQTDLSGVRAFASDGQGNAFTPRVGDSTYVTVQFDVTGNLNKPYSIAIDNGYTSRVTPALNFGIGSPGRYRVTWGPFPMLMDKEHRFTVVLDSTNNTPDANRSNNNLSFTIKPSSANQAIEFYNAQNLEANHWLSAEFSGSAPRSITTWVPQATSGGFQQILRNVTPSGFATQLSTPFSQPTLTRDQSNPGYRVNTSTGFSARVQSVRVQSDTLRKVRFTSLTSEMTNWLRSETFVQVADANIKNFVSQSLPSNYKASMSVYDTAETLYRAILKRSRYSYVPGTNPDAVATFKSGAGDCGALSSLFVASCRAAGIPARTVTGFSLGSNQWHVWAEFNVKDYGWVPVDLAYAEGMMPNGDQPIYFGVIPELNQRVATSYGFDHQIGSRSMGVLQSAAMWWSGSNIRVRSLVSGCSLTVATATP